MSLDKAQEIIKQAMADRSVYDAMAARESEVWGKILPDRERSEAAIEDMKAGATLGIYRNHSSLFRVANEKRLKFEHGLTLGCGAGRLERELVSRGICRDFHGIDHLCIEEKIVQPTGGQYLMRPKPINEIPAKARRVGEESGAKIPKSSVAAPPA